MKTIRIGVVGLGNMGTHHVKYLAAGGVEGASLGAISDGDQIKINKASDLTNVPRFSSHREMFNSGSIDAAFRLWRLGWPDEYSRRLTRMAEAQRKQMKALLGELERSNPTLRQSMLAALGNVVPTHLLDRDLQRTVAAAAGTPRPEQSTAAATAPLSALLQIARPQRPPSGEPQ